jgi:hypothetical protein
MAQREQVYLDNGIVNPIDTLGTAKMLHFKVKR